MELEELKSTWEQMSEHIKQQKLLNDKMIMDMTKLKFKNKIDIIARYEGIGAIVCLTAAFIIFLNLQVFDTFPLKICAGLTLLILVGLPVLTFATIYQMSNIDFTSKNNKDTLMEFTEKRAQFLLIQRWGIALCGLLMFTIIPVMMKISSGKDFFEGNSQNVLWFFPLGLLFIALMARWGYNCYVNITQDAQAILNDLEAD